VSGRRFRELSVPSEADAPELKALAELLGAPGFDADRPPSSPALPTCALCRQPLTALEIATRQRCDSESDATWWECERCAWRAEGEGVPPLRMLH
jgi:hypothetical protein